MGTRTMGERYDSATRWAYQINGALREDDPRMAYGNVVQIIFHDGSNARWVEAFAVHRDGFLIVFTAHHGVCLHPLEDIAAHSWRNEDGTIRDPRRPGGVVENATPPRDILIRPG